MATIEEMIEAMKNGKAVSVELDVTVGKSDQRAMQLLQFIFEDMDDGTITFQDVRDMLVEALWWMGTFGVIATEDD